MDITSQSRSNVRTPSRDRSVSGLRDASVSRPVRLMNFYVFSGNAFVVEAGGLRCKSRAGQIGHSVANGLPLLRHFVEMSCVAQAQ